MPEKQNFLARLLHSWLKGREEGMAAASFSPLLCNGRINSLQHVP